jgi:hypothetical protein
MATLTCNPLLDPGPRRFEAQPADGDRTEFRKADVAVTVYGECVLALGIAKQLDFQPIAGPDYVVDRHRDVLHGRESGPGGIGEQIMAEGLECWLERHRSQANAERQQQALDGQTLRRLDDGQAGHGNRRQPR